MIQFFKSLLSGDAQSQSAKRFSGILIVISFIVFLFTAAIYFMAKMKILEVPDNIISALTYIAVSCFLGTTVEKFSDIFKGNSDKTPPPPAP